MGFLGSLISHAAKSISASSKSRSSSSRNRTIADYKKDYANARANNDAAAMHAANKGANAIRTSTGQATQNAYQDISNTKKNAHSGNPGGGRDYSATLYDPSASYDDKVSAYNSRLSKEAGMRANGTWDNSWAPTTDFQGIIAQQINPPTQTDPYVQASQAYEDKMLAQNERAAQMYRVQVDQGVDRLNAQRGDINSAHDDAARQAYISYMQGQKAAPQQLAALGMTGGASESSLIAANTGYQNNLNNVNTARGKAMNGIDTAITDLQNSGDVQTAQHILGNADKSAESYLSALNADIGRNDNMVQQTRQNAYNDAAMTGVYNGKPTLDTQQIAYGQQQDGYNRALEMAKTTGDFSVMRQFGWTDAQINSVNVQYQASNGGGGRAGSSRSGDSKSTAPSVYYGDDMQDTTTQDGRKAPDGAMYDYTSVLALGYGPIDQASLDKLIASGEVGYTVVDGKLKVHKNKATTAPKFPTMPKFF